MLEGEGRGVAWGMGHGWCVEGGWRMVLSFAFMFDGSLIEYTALLYTGGRPEGSGVRVLAAKHFPQVGVRRL